MSQTQDQSDASLAKQYEAYPYPQRNPNDEKQRLLIGSPSHLNEIDYWVFGGTRSTSKSLRILVAGCGTGDGAIMIAQQMARAKRPGEVICLDRSQASLAIAKKRAEIRKLENIRFIQDSLLNLPKLELGLFDYIDCCGVLHHLPNPASGLKILRDALNPGGGIGLMVYAPYGRTGVYMLQDALAHLAPETESPSLRLDTAKRIMRHLPATAWLRANGNFGDHLSGGDAGLYDLLLNPRDQAYTIKALWDLIDECDLQISGLIEPERYNPKLLIADPKIRTKMAQLDQKTQAIIAEDLTGNMATHVVYIKRKNEPITFADPNALDSIPFMREMPGEILAQQIQPSNFLPFEFGTLTVMIPMLPQARGFLGMIDGKRTVGEMFDIMANRGVPKEKLPKIWQEIFEQFKNLNRVFVRSIK